MKDFETTASFDGFLAAGSIHFFGIAYCNMVFKEKKETYLALIDAAGEIIACKNRQEVSEKASLFLKLYLGRTHVIADADSEVNDKKIAFKEKLDAYLGYQINESP